MSMRPLAILLLTMPLASAEPADPDSDLLRFMNGDVLHGRFESLQDGSLITWSGTNLKTPVVLQTNRIRRLALNGGRSAKSLAEPAHVLLSDGDHIPGRLIAFDEEHITIDSAVAGSVTLPRDHIRALVPNPHGGSLHYIGPFSPDNWTVITPPETEEEDAEEDDAPKQDKDAAGADADAEEDEEEEEEEAPWMFADGAWYNNSTLPIKVDADIPDQARIACRIAWRSRLAVVIAFHATTELPDPPEPVEDPDEDDPDTEKAKKNAPAQQIRPVIRRGSSGNYAVTYGHSYVLVLHPSYSMLYRCDFDEHGNPKQSRLPGTGSNVRLEDSGQAEIELRCDRKANSITLFVNGIFGGQWEDRKGYVGTGTHLAFACPNEQTRLRVSDVSVSAWNGMLDSARSMEVDDRDVVLLTNGTDRFSGKLTAFEDDKFHLQGTFAEMQIPLEQVQEIRFARKGLAEIPTPSGKAVRLLLHPVGRLTVEPLTATRSVLEAHNPTLGNVNLDLRYASVLEFAFGDSILDSWDDEF